MNDSFEDRLGRSLTEIVPGRPPGDLAGAARTWARRRRRRRQGIVAASAAVAVLAAIGIPWAVTRGGDDDLGPAFDPKVAPLECPAKIDRGSLPGKPGEPLRTGAVRAQFCPAGGASTFQPPRDALETRLDEFVALVNAQPAPNPNICPLTLGTAWTVFLQYADGAVASVTGGNGGCGRLYIGPHDQVPGRVRDGAQGVYQKYLDLLAAQRATREPPDAEVPLPCPSDNPGDPPFSPAHRDRKALGLTGAVLCWKTETQTETPFHSVELDDELVALVDADIAERSTGRQHDGGAECNDQLRVEIVAQNGWGDRTLVSGYGCGLYGGDDWFWRPSAKVQERLGELIESQPPPEVLLPTAEDQPEAVVRAWADLVNLGQRAQADSLWAVEPTLPRAGVTKIGFSGGTNVRRVDRPEPGTPAAAYSQVRLMEDAIYWEGTEKGDVRDVDVTIVRDTYSEPWRILEITDQGAASVGW